MQGSRGTVPGTACLSCPGSSLSVLMGHKALPLFRHCSQLQQCTGTRASSGSGTAVFPRGCQQPPTHPVSWLLFVVWHKTAHVSAFGVVVVNCLRTSRALRSADKSIVVELGCWVAASGRAYQPPAVHTHLLHPLHSQARQVHVGWLACSMAISLMLMSSLGSDKYFIQTTVVV